MVGRDRAPVALVQSSDLDPRQGGAMTNANQPVLKMVTLDCAEPRVLAT